MPWTTLVPSQHKLPGPPLTPAEMELLVARAGLALNAGQMADLVLAWRQLSGLIAAIPRSATMADDQAYVFRLPPPAPSAGRAGKRTGTAAAKAKPRAKAAAKAKAAAGKTKPPVRTRTAPRAASTGKKPARRR